MIVRRSCGIHSSSSQAMIIIADAAPPRGNGDESSTHKSEEGAPS